MYQYRHCSLINLGKSLNQKRQIPEKGFAPLKKPYHTDFKALIFILSFQIHALGYLKNLPCN